MKIIGFILIVFSSSLAGLYFSKRICETVLSMKQIEKIISVLISGTENGRYSLDELKSEIESACGEEKTIIIFKYIQTKGKTESLFCGNIVSDKALIHALSLYGTCFAKEQIKELEYDREAVRKEIILNEKEYIKNSKLVRSLGVFSGFLIAILLF